MGVGADGTIEVFNSHGSAHCLVDVFGYSPRGPASGSRRSHRHRLFDTRTGQGIRPGKMPTDAPVDVQVAGLAGVPASGATAVVMNLTVTEAESTGWMRSTRRARRRHVERQLLPGDTVPNLVIEARHRGQITVDGLGARCARDRRRVRLLRRSGHAMRTVAPKRMLDTREGLGAREGEGRRRGLDPARDRRPARGPARRTQP